MLRFMVHHLRCQNTQSGSSAARSGSRSQKQGRWRGSRFLTGISVSANACSKCSRCDPIRRHATQIAVAQPRVDLPGRLNPPPPPGVGLL